MTETATEDEAHLGSIGWVSTEEVLTNCLKANLQDVVVVGTDPNGESFVSSSYGKIGDVLYLLERAKNHLMLLADRHPTMRPVPGDSTP